MKKVVLFGRELKSDPKLTKMHSSIQIIEVHTRDTNIIIPMNMP